MTAKQAHIKGRESNQARLLELMLFKEAGGIGYDVSIAAYAAGNKAYYEDLLNKIKSIKEGV